MVRNTCIAALTLLASAATVFSCTGKEEEAGGKKLLEISIPGFETRAESQTGPEKNISSLDIYAFREMDGTLADHVRAGSGPVAMYLDPDVYDVYVVANRPSDDTEYTESGLSGLQSDFTENSPSCFVMGAGPQRVVMDTDRFLSFSLARTTAKIVVEGGITLDFSSLPLLAAKNPTIRSVFMINIPKTAGPISGNPSQDNSTMYNRGGTLLSEGRVDPSVPSLTWINTTEDSGISSMTGFPLYCHPNNEPESPGRSGTDYVTKLVIAVAFGTGIQYYPIGIPGIERNKVYTVSGIRITGPGSDDPNKYVPDNGYLSATIKVSVLDWDTSQQGDPIL